MSFTNKRRLDTTDQSDQSIKKVKLEDPLPDDLRKSIWPVKVVMIGGLPATGKSTTMQKFISVLFRDDNMPRKQIREGTIFGIQNSEETFIVLGRYLKTIAK